MTRELAVFFLFCFCATVKSQSTDPYTAVDTRDLSVSALPRLVVCYVVCVNYPGNGERRFIQLYEYIYIFKKKKKKVHVPNPVLVQSNSFRNP